MATVLWLCFKLPSCLFGITRNTSVMHKKAKFVSFNYMQLQKVKFKSVQINMKQVSYMYWLKETDRLILPFHHYRVASYSCLRYSGIKLYA